MTYDFLYNQLELSSYPSPSALSLLSVLVEKKQQQEMAADMHCIKISVFFLTFTRSPAQKIFTLSGDNIVKLVREKQASPNCPFTQNNRCT